MDIVDTLRASPVERALHEQAALEIERLRGQNEILLTAIRCADTLMAGAPIWHSQHRQLADLLVGLRETLAADAAGQAAASAAVPLRRAA